MYFGAFFSVAMEEARTGTILNVALVNYNVD